jgi:hypothetical protein
MWKLLILIQADEEQRKVRPRGYFLYQEADGASMSVHSILQGEPWEGPARSYYLQLAMYEDDEH